jgi:hypothetical protein
MVKLTAVFGRRRAGPRDSAAEIEIRNGSRRGGGPVNRAIAERKNPRWRRLWRKQKNFPKPHIRAARTDQRPGFEDPPFARGGPQKSFAILLAGPTHKELRRRRLYSCRIAAMRNACLPGGTMRPGPGADVPSASAPGKTLLDRENAFRSKSPRDCDRRGVCPLNSLFVAFLRSTKCQT